MSCGEMIGGIIKASASGSASASLASFMADKTEERISRFDRKRKNDDDSPKADRPAWPKTNRHVMTKGGGQNQNANKQNSNESVLINIGTARENDQKGGVANVGGSKLPTRVGKHFNYQQVVDTAVKKHSDHDQYFCSADEYVLLYPDQKLATEVPGTGKPFTVQEY